MDAAAAPEPEPTEENLLQRCLDRSEGDQLEELERLCRAHPQLAAGLRRRYALLASHGLVSLPLAPGHRWGAYRLLEEIGRGGMGVVYLAEHTEWRRRVALTFLSPELAGSERAAERFRREIAALTKLDHPGLCTVYEAGTHHGQPFVAMRFVPGRTLAAELAAMRQAGTRPPVAQVLAWFEPIARAVDCAHAAGIVHRDLKPANVMLQADGVPVVLDFGLARDSSSGDVTLTASQDAIGTPAYMAPEQVRGEAVGPWTDVHALGAMLHEALTLAVAFPGTSRTEVFHRVQHEAPPRLRVLRPDLGRDLELVLASCLDKDPARRYARAGALADDLRALPQRRPIAARPLPAWLRAWRWAQRNRVAATVLVATTLMATVAVWFALAQASADRAMRGRNLVLATIEAADDADLAAMYAEAAYRLQPNTESLDFLRSALFEVHEDVRLQHVGSTWKQFAMVDDDRVVVLTATGGELWHRRGEWSRALQVVGDPRAVAVGPDRTIAIASARRVTLFDADGRDLGWKSGEITGARSVCWIDRDRLVVSRVGGATILDRRGTDSVAIDLPGAEGSQTMAALAANGTVLVLGTQVGAFVVDLAGGEPGPVCELVELEGRGAAFRVAVDRDGQHVLAATSTWLGYSDFYGEVSRPLLGWWRRHQDGWQLVGAIDEFTGDVLAVSVSPDGSRFAFSTKAGQVRIHDADDAKLVQVIDLGRGESGFHLSWSPDGNRMAVTTANRITSVFDRSGALVDTLRCFSVWQGEFEPDGAHLWTLGMDCLQRNRLQHSERVLGFATSLFFAAPVDEHEVLLAGTQPAAELWRAGAKVMSLQLASRSLGWVLHATPVAGGFLMSGIGGIQQFDSRGLPIGEPLALGHGWASRVLPLRDGRLLAVQNGTPGAALINPDRSASQLEGADTAWGGDVTPEGRWLALAGMTSQRLQVWDLHAAPPRVAWSHPVPSSFHTRGVAISEDGGTVVVGDGDGEISVFTQVGRVRHWQAHAAVINDVDLAADGRIVTASADRTAAVWTPTGDRIAHLRGHSVCVWSARFTPSGRRVVTAGDDGRVFIWPLDAEDVLALARRDVHPEFRRRELGLKQDLVGDLLDRR